MSVYSSLLQSDLGSTLHDRERREQRCIVKTDLLRARRYGMCEPARHGRLKYTCGGMVFIWDPVKNVAITSYPLEPRNNNGTAQQQRSGSKYTDPILIAKSESHEKAYLHELHQNARKDIIRDKKAWKSHTVLVVDMSGSMRTDDVNGARCRSDGVWTCLARDFVRQPIEEGLSGLHDLVSVVVMREQAEVVLRYEPTDMVLYNKLVDLREWSTLKPASHGNYIPALHKAEELLRVNDLGTCAPSLFFFSDGKPSDSYKADIAPLMGKIASRFGRRLTVCCIGMAGRDEDFSTLEDMTAEAKAFGATASFNKPSLSADSLSHIVSTHATSLTSTKSELTDLKTGKAKQVRTDVVRERRGTVDDGVAPDPNEWRIFGLDDDSWVDKISKWHGRSGEFYQVIDHRCFLCFRTVVDDTYRLLRRGHRLCECQVLHFCQWCAQMRAATFNHSDDACRHMASKRRKGFYQKDQVPSFSVAWKKTCFGEGAERLAFKFRFLDANGNFTGPKMVAKESRFVQDVEAKSDSYLTSSNHEYHRAFMRTQALASKFADQYNAHVEQLARDFDSPRIRKFPRIRFLEPMVIQLIHEGESVNVLVEPMLEGNYAKVNNNFGGLASVRSNQHDSQDRTADLLLGRTPSQTSNAGRLSRAGTTVGGGLLGAIVEGSEDEESDSDGDDSFDEHAPRSERTDDQEECFDRFFIGDNKPRQCQLARKEIPDVDFAHAFSHFSYVRSGGKLMVVDLQGTLDVKPDGSREYVFTDPAVHQRKRPGWTKYNFGRTDRGMRGINAFFKTHECNDACRFLGLEPRRKGRRQKATS